jgi:CheY-like chemotaxis protein
LDAGLFFWGLREDCMRPLILQIDDDPELPARVAEILEEDGYELHQTADPEDAMRVVEERRPLLVVMEIQLPGCEGLDLMAGIRDAYGGEVPVLVLTELPRDTAEHGEAIALGCLDFLTKPVPASALLAAIREVAPVSNHAATAKAPAAAAEDLSGDLAETPMPELLARLRRRGESGVLAVGHKGMRVGVQLRNGSPVGVSSSRREPVAEAVLYETFRWEEGHYAFSEGRWLESDSMLDLAGDPAGLLLAGVLDASPANLVHERLAKRESLYVSITDESEAALEAEGVGFTRGQRKLLESLGGEDTLSVLIESEAFDERLVYALWVGGWLELRTAPTLTLTDLLGDMTDLEPELEEPEALPGERDRELAELRQARAERERELEQLARTREEREQELEELARAREERERELEEFARARAEHEREHDALAPALEERAQELEELERARDERARELEELARTREQQEQEVARLARARDARAREHEALAPALEERAQELEDLARAREERERELEELAQMREQHEQEVARLALARDARAREHRALAPALEEGAQELEELGRARAKRAQELAELERARAERAREVDALARMREEQEQELEDLARAREERARELEELARAREERARELAELETARAERTRELEALTPPPSAPTPAPKQSSPVGSEPAPKQSSPVGSEPAPKPAAPAPALAQADPASAEPEQRHGEIALVGGPDPIGTLLRELAKRVLGGNDFEALGIEPSASDVQVHRAYMAIMDEIPKIEPNAANLVHSQQAKRIRSRVEAAFGNLRDAEKRRAYSLLQQEEEQDRKAKPSAERALEGERWFRKGKAHLDGKRCEEAIEAFGMASHLDPEQGEYASHLGYALYLSNPKDEVVQREAMEHLASGIKRSPRCELSHVFLGRILKAKGDVDVARKIFLKALRIKPDFHPAVQELRVLEMRERKSKGVLSRLIGR